MKDRREKCTFCRKTFMTAFHHRQHRWVHYGDHPYICVVTGCGARFDTTNELIAHKHSHGYHLSYGCELKGCSFSYCGPWAALPPWGAALPRCCLHLHQSRVAITFSTLAKNFFSTWQPMTSPLQRKTLRHREKWKETLAPSCGKLWVKGGSREWCPKRFRFFTAVGQQGI